MKEMPEINGGLRIVLIVDPDHSRAEQYASELDALGFHAITVPDSEAAIRISKGLIVDILVCRVILEIVDDVTGYEVLSAVSKDRPVLALMMSGFSRAFIRSVRGYDQNVPLMLEPFTAKEIARCVVGLINQSKAV